MPSRGGYLRDTHGYGESIGSYIEPTYSQLGGGKSGSYADLSNNRMPSYGEQIHQNFGVRLRPSEPHRLRPPNPCDNGGEGHGIIVLLAMPLYGKAFCMKNWVCAFCFIHHCKSMYELKL